MSNPFPFFVTAGYIIYNECILSITQLYIGRKSVQNMQFNEKWKKSIINKCTRNVPEKCAGRMCLKNGPRNVLKIVPGKWTSKMRLNNVPEKCA